MIHAEVFLRKEEYFTTTKQALASLPKFSLESVDITHAYQYLTSAALFLFKTRHAHFSSVKGLHGTSTASKQTTQQLPSNQRKLLPQDSYNSFNTQWQMK